MKKLLSLLGAIGLVATASSTVVACPKKSEETSSSIKDLSDLPVKELGAIKGTGDTPSVVDLVKAINAKNKDYGLDDKDVVIDGTPSDKTATIKASDKSTNFKGSVTLTYTYEKDTSKREKFNLSLVEDVINKTGLAGAVRPNDLNIGFLTTPDLRNKEKIVSSVRDFIDVVVEAAKALYNLNTEQIMGMIEIDYQDNNGASIDPNNDNKDTYQIIGSVKQGHENDIDGFTAEGKATIKLKQQTLKLSDIVKTKALGKINIDSDDAYTIKNTIMIAAQNSNSELKTYTTSINPSVQILNYDLDKGTARIAPIINSDFISNDIVEISYEVVRPEAGNSLLDFTVMSNSYDPNAEYNLGLPLDLSEEPKESLDSWEDSDIANVVNYLTELDGTYIEYWSQFYTTNKRYFLDSQKDEDKTKAENQLVSYEQFKKDFKDIFELTLEDYTSSEESDNEISGIITLKVKNGKENIYASQKFSLSGSIKVYYSLTGGY
ncbi:hypothetical protein SGLAD_v1c06700 [Spiroplasma gladiatoris]|uniref:Lipoprotein n=1 Tax=Spiroplasma gladiatoris TaxID=2143 RepID=A0A4V1AQB0_9MOLU|nr:lipoprotein [Spiroplasma gladiatoris]QBQ07869.1 hypothetical protein SGLAD_v1c06700 [Spiroplasma gladiatoris]